jgi:hypothetical protein
MASIKNIINSDDEYGDSPPLKKDKSSTSGPFRDPPPPATHPGYISTIPLPSLSPHSSAHDQRRSSPSAHYLHSLTSNTSNTSPVSPSTDLATRRRSNTSVDSMESIYNQAYHQAGPSHGAARPFIAAGNTQEPSVKLTPVTGRVSRAKKGVPVHTCDQCRPPKVRTITNSFMMPTSFLCLFMELTQTLDIHPGRAFTVRPCPTPCHHQITDMFR